MALWMPLQHWFGQWLGPKWHQAIPQIKADMLAIRSLKTHFYKTLIKMQNKNSPKEM